MVEGDVPHSAWPTYNLQQLEKAVNDAKIANKYLFIWDKQGAVATFMQYKGQLAPLGPEIVKKALGRQTPADVGEFIRKNFIRAMREGERLCFDLENAAPNWGEYVSDGTFTLDFFNWEWLNQEGNYMPFVREEENMGLGG